MEYFDAQYLYSSRPATPKIQPLSPHSSTLTEYSVGHHGALDNTPVILEYEY